MATGCRFRFYYLKGVRGYRAIARRLRRGRRRNRPAVLPEGRCAVWVRLPRSAARSTRLRTRAVDPNVYQHRRLRKGSSLQMQARLKIVGCVQMFKTWGKPNYFMVPSSKIPPYKYKAHLSTLLDCRNPCAWFAHTNSCVSLLGTANDCKMILP